MNMMGVVFIAILVLCAMLGWRRGLTAKLGGVISMLISCLLVSALLPVVTQVIKTQTPVYEVIAQSCEDMINTQTAGIIAGVSDSISQEEITAYGLTGSDVLNSLTRIEQTKLIKSLPVPSVIQKMLINYNNSAGYSTLGASTFAAYLARFIADGVVNILAFVVTMVIASLAVRAIIGALGLLAHLPVIYEVNRVGGLVCGILQGLFVIWGIMLILTALSGTSIGAQLLTQADANMILTPVYESNLFMRIVAGAMSSL